MTTQDNIFHWYTDIARFMGRYPDPPDIAAIKDAFPEHRVIEVWLAMFGGSEITWRYGHVERVMDDLIQAYGERLIPYLKLRICRPLHGGGTAYGEAKLQVSKDRCKVFCQRALQRLEAAS